MKRVFYLLTLGLLLGACKGDDPAPEKTTVTVNVDWSVLPEGETPPTEYYAFIDGVEYPLSSLNNTLELDFNGESRQLLVYNRPDGLSINNGVASLIESKSTKQPRFDSLGRDFDLVYGTVVMPSDQLASGLINAQVEAKPGSVDLGIGLNFTGGTIVNFEDVVIEISNLAGTRDMKTDSLGDPITQPQIGIIQAESNSVSADFDILGVSGATNTVVITINPNSSSPITLQSDITSYLKDLNSQMKSLDLSIDVDIDHLIELGDFTINGWEEGKIVSGEASN